MTLLWQVDKIIQEIGILFDNTSVPGRAGQPLKLNETAHCNISEIHNNNNNNNYGISVFN